MITREELLDFANMVFSMSAGPTNFGKILPKAYSEDNFGRLLHSYIKEDRLKGLIDIYPFELKVGEESLKAGYVGTVSVHPDSENKGYMKQLMKQTFENARNNDMDILILDGSRMRYQYYDFEKAGKKFCFNITESSLKHGSARYANEEVISKIAFVPMEDIDLDYAYELYKKRNLVARTRENFMITLNSWEATAYTILLDGEFLGYMDLSNDEQSIFEIELTNTKLLIEVLSAFKNEFEQNQFGVIVGADEVDKIKGLNLVSEYFTINLSHHIKILNYEKAIKFFLSWKQKYEKLEDGEFDIAVEGYNYHIEVKASDINVDRQRSEGINTLTGIEFVNKYMTAMYELEENKTAPKGWFPLPFFLPEADCF